ncbi:MAG: nucleotidyltransferase domain-containing protein [Candidatus Woesearchaeota archaeon]
MNSYKLKFTMLEQDIIQLLALRSGEKFSQREIAKILTVSPTAISKSIPKLEKSTLITVEKTNITHYVSYNTFNKQAIELKRVQNLRIIYTSGLKEFLCEHLAGSTIIVFGSFSKGEDTKDSDIDIAIIGRKPKKIPLEKYELKTFRKINLNFYKSWNDIHIHLKNNILQGFVLHGSVQL